jgi:hypothetical protein
LEGWGFEDEIDLSCICADILGDFACLIHWICCKIWVLFIAIDSLELMIIYYLWLFSKADKDRLMVCEWDDKE